MDKFVLLQTVKVNDDGSVSETGWRSIQTSAIEELRSSRPDIVTITYAKARDNGTPWHEKVVAKTEIGYLTGLLNG